MLKIFKFLGAIGDVYKWKKLRPKLKIPCPLWNPHTYLHFYPHWNKKTSVLNRTEVLLPFINHLNILTYAFPITGEFRQGLLRNKSISSAILFGDCNSGVIFRYLLLAPGFHHLRFAMPFWYTLLSPSSLLSVYTLYYSKKTLNPSRLFSTFWNFS